MADTELGEFYGSVVRKGPVSTWAGMIGGLTSLALVAGIGVWGYKLMLRDVNGIPVIRALEGPMRIQPKDPGGERMANQGLAVNQVAAAGEAGDISEQLTLAPPVAGLLDHDLPQAELAFADVPDFTDATDDAVAAALENPEADDAGLTDPDAVPPAEVAMDASEAISPDAIAASVPGVRKSPRPPVRPAALTNIVAASAPVEERVAEAADEAVEISADTLPAGSRLVQLGAFESIDLARSEWGRMAVKFADVMTGKMRVIQEATSGGQTFFRLRVAGFEDLADARRFCATLAADKSKPLCVPVATR